MGHEKPMIFGEIITCLDSNVILRQHSLVSRVIQPKINLSRHTSKSISDFCMIFIDTVMLTAIDNQLGYKSNRQKAFKFRL